MFFIFLKGLIFRVVSHNFNLCDTNFYLGVKGLIGEEDFKNALYMIDIGQNDLVGPFSYLPYPQVIEKIPTFIAEIKFAILVSLFLLIFIIVRKILM